ncbi:hypothetical protein D9611_014027 [Ephemerocybe angulata]|uniref:Uncharacterized protein n=1 Tax=Ephemerocybe angulata TaxID=980116 RepID=A0A8H5AQN1_9AGAR|nr:hypothetical protein D9611_014027 [Tulosesus angulatus]
MSNLIEDLDMNTSFDLPSYSPSIPAPLYSCEPSLDEQRLQLTPGTAATRRTPTGSYIKRNGKITVILNEQEEGIDYPSYGRHGPINGTCGKPADAAHGNVSEAFWLHCAAS